MVDQEGNSLCRFGAAVEEGWQRLRGSFYAVEGLGRRRIIQATAVTRKEIRRLGKRGVFTEPVLDRALEWRLVAEYELNSRFD